MQLLYFDFLLGIGLFLAFLTFVAEFVEVGIGRKWQYNKLARLKYYFCNVFLIIIAISFAWSYLHKEQEFDPIMG